MSWKWDLSLNHGSGLSVLGACFVCRAVPSMGCRTAALLSVPCQLPRGSSCLRTGLWWGGWEGARPVSAWWRVLPNWGCGVVCCLQCSVQWDDRLQWGLEGHGGFTQAWLNGKIMCFLATLKVFRFLIREGKIVTWNCWRERGNSVSDRPDVLFQRLNPVLMMLGVSFCWF